MPRAATAPLYVTTDDGSRTLYSARFAQTYASVRGALSEAREVFLTNSGVAARLAAGSEVRLLEVGFGTGLNFFVTAQACLANLRARLHYTALENTLLAADTVRELGYAEHVGDALLTPYTEWREGLGEASGLQVFTFRNVTLELLIGDATAQVLPRAETIYHDAFSPEVNPELWSDAFLETLARALEPDGTLVSYCVQGAVRRRLQAAGLEVSKRPGKGKREVLLARKPVHPKAREPSP